MDNYIRIFRELKGLVSLSGKDTTGMKRLKIQQRSHTTTEVHTVLPLFLDPQLFLLHVHRELGQGHGHVLTSPIWVR